MYHPHHILLRKCHVLHFIYQKLYDLRRFLLAVAPALKQLKLKIFVSSVSLQLVGIK